MKVIECAVRVRCQENSTQVRRFDLPSRKKDATSGRFIFRCAAWISLHSQWRGVPVMRIFSL
jgi:hypothetical protein